MPWFNFHAPSSVTPGGGSAESLPAAHPLRPTTAAQTMTLLARTIGILKPRAVSRQRFDPARGLEFEQGNNRNTTKDPNASQ